MNELLKFQMDILSDPAARKALSENPSEALKKYGISVPPGTELPATIPLEDIEARVKEAQERLAERGLAVDLSKASPDESQKVLSDVFKNELWGVRRTGTPSAVLRPERVATVAVMAAVVLVVVA